MNIIFIAIIGGADGDNGFEGWWLAGSNLQRIETTPRNAEHAHLAGTPFLFGQPSDDFNCVILLLLGVFIGHQPVAVAIAAHIDTDRGIAVASEIRMGERITHMGAIAFSIGKIFKQGWHRIFLGICWDKHARRQLHAIGHGDPKIFNFFSFARKLGDGFNGHNVLLQCVKGTMQQNP